MDKGNKALLARVVDVETSSIKSNEASVCEFGSTDVVIGENGAVEIAGNYNSFLTKPVNPITPGAQSIHHISNEMVEGLEHFHDLPNIANGADVLVAHSADYEQMFIKAHEPWICTFKCSKFAWPELERHTNQFFRYHFEFDIPNGNADPVHRAGPDSMVTAYLLRELLKVMSIQQMIRVSVAPVIHHICNLKKYKGQKWEDVVAKDVRYAQWILGADFDEDIKATVSHWLKQ